MEVISSLAASDVVDDVILSRLGSDENVVPSLSGCKDVVDSVIISLLPSLEVEVDARGVEDTSSSCLVEDTWAPGGVLDDSHALSPPLGT